MPRMLWIAGGFVLLLVAFVVLSRMLTTNPADFPSDPGLENPLPVCPSSPNCVRVSRRVAMSPKAAWNAAHNALEAMGAATIEGKAPILRHDAVFNAFVFKDDVTVVIEPDGDSSALHLRSASRVGYSDLGVNARRVKRFFEAFAAQQ